jgi:hypothetical protein
MLHGLRLGVQNENLLIGGIYTAVTDALGSDPVNRRHNLDKAIILDISEKELN